jgi:hypothetical protein
VTAALLPGKKKENFLQNKCFPSSLVAKCSISDLTKELPVSSFGPQKVLSGMIRNINRDAEVFSIDKYEDIDAVVSVTN